MISHLHIENIAVIESADIDFENCFVVLTGETGAGKSILIDSINMLIGNRTSRDIVRTGCKKAKVEAVFEASGLEKLYAEYGIEAEDDGCVYLAREINADGKSVARINSRQVPASVLKEFGKRLITLHGQQDNGALLDSSLHVKFLDSYAEDRDLLKAYKEEYRAYGNICSEINKLDVDDSEKARRVDLLSFQISEIEAADIVEGEEDALKSRRKFLMNAEKVIEAVSYVGQLLSDGDTNVSGLLSQTVKKLDSVSDLTEKLSDCYSRSEDLYAEIEALAGDVRSICDESEFSPRELEETEERLDVINSLKRKYGGSIAEINEYLQNAKKELEEISFSDDRLKHLRAEADKCFERLKKQAEILSDARKKASVMLSGKISEELADLEMPKVKFSVSVTEKDYASDGGDRVEFLISPNVGEELKPLSSIASGGELSRIMLAMRNILSANGCNETLIFDEIDTGVSGKAAGKIALKMRRMSKNAQIISVTHLAQLAAFAGQHLKIEKNDDGMRTFTTVTSLNREARIEEISRILGGDMVASALKTAEDMLDTASKI